MKTPHRSSNRSCDYPYILQNFGEFSHPHHAGPSGRAGRWMLDLRLIATLLFLAAASMMPACRRQATPSQDVWAEVDGQPISREQVERMVHRRGATAGAAADIQETQSFELNILDEMINRQILLEHATRSGITVSEAEVDTQVSQMESPDSKENFEKKLEAQGLDLAELRDEIRSNLVINKLIHRDITSHVAVSDEEIAAYYDHNKANFNVPEMAYHLAQILVTPGTDPEVHNLRNDDAKDPQTANRKIQALYAQLRSGADFATVAEEYSEDPRSASNGGDLGFIPVSGLNSNPQLKQVVNNLKPGQMSGIIQTPQGYHIVKLLGIEKAGLRSLTDPEVESAIRNTLMNEKEQLLRVAYIDVLRQRATVRNYLADQILKNAGESPQPALSTD
jgi:peptidyl-prolyl cis-trans isomerase SurA